MLLSIIVPTYNCCDYLQACLEKLDKLDPLKVEVIVINDGSKDETRAFLESHYSEKSNYVIHHQENGGISNARNAGLSRVSGNYVYFCDSDDEIFVPQFQEIILEIEKNKYDIITANFINETPEKKLGKIYYPRKKQGPMSGEEFLSSHLKTWSYGSECVQFFLRTSLIKNARFQEGIMHEDDHFFPPILLEAKNILVTDKIIYLRKYRTGSLTRSQEGVKRNPNDILFVINSFQEKTSKNPIIFNTLRIRSWISLLDYLNKNHDSLDRDKIISKRPNPFKVLLDSNVLLNFRLKYFRRALRIK